MALPKKSSSKRVGRESFWTPVRMVLTLIVVGLISALGLSSCNSKDVATKNAPANRAANAPPPAQPPAAFVNLPQALRDTQLHTLDGESLKLSDYSDNVVVLNLWATWCGPCRQEMPELVKMSNEYKARGLVVLGLATTYNEQRGGEEGVKEYVKQNNFPYQIIWDDGTLAGPLFEAVQGRSVIPQSFVMWREGSIVKHF